MELSDDLVKRQAEPLVPNTRFFSIYIFRQMCFVICESSCLTLQGGGI